MHPCAGVKRIVLRAGHAHARRGVRLSQRFLPAIYMQRNNRQSCEDHANICILCIGVSQQLIAISFADGLAAVIVGIVVNPYNMQIPDAFRALCIEGQLRPIIPAIQTQGTIECLSSGIIAQLILAVAHAKNQ